MQERQRPGSTNVSQNQGDVSFGMEGNEVNYGQLQP